MNGYSVTIHVSNYEIRVDAMAENGEEAFEQALYTLINSEPKIDLFNVNCWYEAEFIEEIEED